MTTFLRSARALVRGHQAAGGREPSAYYRQDFSAEDQALVAQVEPFTMTGAERIIQLARAVEYVVRNDVPGAFVECGVWRGGSMMCVAYTLLRLGIADRDLYLFDTYDGMTPPEAVDRSHDGTPAAAILATSEKSAQDRNWAYAALEDVQRNLALTGYPVERLHFVKGKVEDTIPGRAPRLMALLRLDTDWYASTRHELVHLYPRLAGNGVLVIDDYGWWQGARQAVDEYFGELEFAPLLHRIDETGRSCIKPVYVSQASSPVPQDVTASVQS
jgi:hypothetical protein